MIVARAFFPTRLTKKQNNSDSVFFLLVLFRFWARILSSQYKELSEKEMKKWNALAEKDKVRYEKEMSTYVPMEEPGGKKKKAKKDPNAPMEAPKTYAEGQSAHRYTPEERAAQSLFGRL